MNEEQKLLFNFGGITFFAGMLIGVLIGFSIGRASLPNLSGGAATVASGIESAKDFNQQADAERAKAEAGIAGAEKSADRIEASIEQSADTTSQLAASIDRCQQILDRVRERGQEKTK